MPEDNSNSNVRITLHWLEKSRSQRILWLLEELKLDYELKVYKRGKDMLAPAELKDVHPLGKSPVVEIQAPGATKPLILAESGAIVEYITAHLGKWMIPKQYAEGKEDQIGGETEEWLRYRHYIHYAEGSLMPFLLIALIVSNIKNAPLPFFLKFITSGIAAKIETAFLKPNFETHFSFLESQMASVPDSGDFLCGRGLTGADILMIFPLEAARARAGLTAEKFPKLSAYIDRMQEREAYKRAIQKIIDATGEYDPKL